MPDRLTGADRDQRGRTIAPKDDTAAKVEGIKRYLEERTQHRRELIIRFLNSG